MSIIEHKGAGGSVVSPETMHELILSYGLIPFFANAIPGFSIEEHTSRENWFQDDSLGPWDWKSREWRSQKTG